MPPGRCLPVITSTATAVMLRQVLSLSDLLGIVLSWLAAWRITAMLCYERGPGNLFSHLRRGLVRIGLHRLVTCFHCTATWVSAAIVATVFEWRWLSFLMALAIAGAVSITERWLTGLAMVTEDPDQEG